MRKPIQFVQFMLTRLYGKHNISYNKVVNTNTVNKQANTYTTTVKENGHCKTHHLITSVFHFLNLSSIIDILSGTHESSNRTEAI